MLQSDTEKSAEERSGCFVVPEAVFSSWTHEHRSYSVGDTLTLNNTNIFEKQCISETITAMPFLNTLKKYKKTNTTTPLMNI